MSILTDESANFISFIMQIDMSQVNFELLKLQEIADSIEQDIKKKKFRLRTFYRAATRSLRMLLTFAHKGAVKQTILAGLQAAEIGITMGYLAKRAAAAYAMAAAGDWRQGILAGLLTTQLVSMGVMQIEAAKGRIEAQQLASDIAQMKMWRDTYG